MYWRLAETPFSALCGYQEGLLLPQASCLPDLGRPMR